MKRFKEGDLVRHFKYYNLSPEERADGIKQYTVITHAEETETGKELVIYKEIASGRVFARYSESFYSVVDKHKYPKALQEYRFELVNGA